MGKLRKKATSISFNHKDYKLLSFMSKNLYASKAEVVRMAIIHFYETKYKKELGSRREAIKDLVEDSRKDLL